MHWRIWTPLLHRHWDQPLWEQARTVITLKELAGRLWAEDQDTDEWKKWRRMEERILCVRWNSEFLTKTALQHSLIHIINQRKEYKKKMDSPVQEEGAAEGDDSRRKGEKEENKYIVIVLLYTFKAVSHQGNSSVDWKLQTNPRLHLKVVQLKNI